MNGRTLIYWGIAILIISYLANINLGHLISALLTGAQQIHNSNGGH